MSRRLFLLIIPIFALLALESYSAKRACDDSDVKLAINPKNKKFPKIMDTCASDAWGDASKTTKCLKKQYPQLSDKCAACFGKMADCSASNCKFKCMGNHFSDGCLACVENNCRGTVKDSKFSLTNCTGLKAKQLPPKK